MALVDTVVDIETTQPPVPRPLPQNVRKAAEIDGDMLPEVIWNFVADVADRQQSPADFVVAAGLCAISGVIGRKILIQPKKNDTDWRVPPNLWGALIGPPSAMKTPTLKAAVQPLNALEAEALLNFEKAKSDTKIEKEMNLMEVDRLKKEAKSATAGKDHQKVRHLLEQAAALENADEKADPKLRRLIVNNSTVEKLGELLNDSPNGLVMLRDELSGWLSRMNASDAGEERAFYLEAYNGDGSYTFDRIGRGTIRIDSANVALIGGIQPSKLAPLVKGAASGRADDGLVQRLQLAVWPQLSSNWEWRDRRPCPKAKSDYMALFKRLDDLPRFDPKNPDVPIIRFDSEAQGLFAEWSTELNKGIRADRDMNSVLQSHLLKMPQTVARLAGIFALIEQVSTVSQVEMLRALAYSDYLRTHAEKIYGLATNGHLEGARLILQRRDKLPSQFTVRDVYQKGWTGLGTAGDTAEALATLAEHGWVHTSSSEVLDTGGRPTIVYRFVEVQP